MKRLRQLQGLSEITIICHIRPDGDTLGSAFALMHALKKSGKDRVEVGVVKVKFHRATAFFNGPEKAELTDLAAAESSCVDVASPSMAGDGTVTAEKPML